MILRIKIPAEDDHTRTLKSLIGSKCQSLILWACGKFSHHVVDLFLVTFRGAFLEQAAQPGRLGLVDIEEHQIFSIHHLRAVAVAGDDGVLVQYL